MLGGVVTGRGADLSLCHGAAGVAHIAARLFEYSKSADFKRKALEGYAVVLNALEQRSHSARMPLYEFAPGDWQELHGLLRGATGTALALLSASSTITPKWDRMLLLSDRADE